MYESDFIVASAVWGAVFGMAVGLVPAVLGGTRDRLGLGICGFLACGGAGAVLGLLLAVPVCAGFTWAICADSRRSADPQSAFPSGDGQYPAEGRPTQLMVAAQTGKRVVCSQCGSTIAETVTVIHLPPGEALTHGVTEFTAICEECAAQPRVGTPPSAPRWTVPPLPEVPPPPSGIMVTCPECARNYAVPQEQVGRRAKCRCGSVFVVDRHGPTTEGAQGPEARC